MQSTSGPAQERYGLLDALRGFAIFGIFGVNMVASSLAFTTSDSEKWIHFGVADQAFDIFLNAVVEGKFYSIFSLLFGIGFGLQLQLHAGRGLDGLPVFKRRLWGMLLIGLLHLLLLWIGDIVFLYAWLGFILIAFRNSSDRMIFRTAIFCLLLPVLLFPLRFIDTNLTLGIPFYLSSLFVGKSMGVDVMTISPLVMMNKTDPAGYFQANLIAFFYRQADLFDQVRPFKVFAMLLLGMWVSRHKWYATPQLFLQWFAPYIRWVFPLALAVNFGMSFISWDHYYGGDGLGWLKTLLYFLGVVPLSLCYVYFFVKAFTVRSSYFLEAFNYVGRMALSNYIFQSLLYVAFFRGPFMAFGGQVGPLICMLPVILIFPLQVWASKWWLERFRFGPLEWAWRSMTYRSWQPMRHSLG